MSDDSVIVIVDVDLTAYRQALRRAEASMRLRAAHLAYLGTIVGLLSVDFNGGDGSATNAWRTDARDAYYTARDLTEEPR